MGSLVRKRNPNSTPCEKQTSLAICSNLFSLLICFSSICMISQTVSRVKWFKSYVQYFYLLFTPSNSPVLHSGWFSDLYLACFSNYCWFSKLDPLLTQNSYMLIHPQHDRVKQILAGLCTLKPVWKTNNYVLIHYFQP